MIICRLDGLTRSAISEKLGLQKSQVWLLTSNLIAPNKVGAMAPIFMDTADSAGAFNPVGSTIGDAFAHDPRKIRGSQRHL